MLSLIRGNRGIMLLVLILFPAVSAFAASFISTGNGGWVWQDPPAGMPPDTILLSVCFVDFNTGWVVGWNGTILNTTDGGATWASQVSDTTDHLGSVCFVDVNTGWAVGDNGTILRTTNGGGTWTPCTSGTTYDLESVYFIDASTGWAVGDGDPATILNTTNGGVNWTPQTAPYIGFSYDLLGIHFADSSTGCAVGPTSSGQSVIIRTTSGGTSWWFEKYYESPMSLDGVYFADSTTGWVVGDWLKILKTTDAGDNWTSQTVPAQGDPPFPQWLHSVHFADTSTGWIVGANGTLVATRNGGAKWAYQDPGTHQQLYSVCTVDPNTAWVVGYDGTILHTSTAGIPGCAWAKQQSDGKAADFGHLVVTAKFDGHIYAEHPERQSGIRINTTDASVNEGDFIYIHGTVGTTGLERVINASSIEVMTAAWGDLAPEGMNNDAPGGGDLGSPPSGQYGVTGGSGANNVGLLVRCWGRVTDVVPGEYYLVIEDGSGPVRVDTSHLTVLPDVDDYISVTGISSLYGTVGDIHSLVLPRRDSDIAPL